MSLLSRDFAATNYIVDEGKGGKTIDAALVRRFDRKILVDLPDKEGREHFIRKVNGSDNPLRLSEDEIVNIASRSTGMSLADIENVIEMSYRDAIRGNFTEVNDKIFEDAFETYNSGSEKKNSEDSILRVARHEAGHAFMCWYDGETPSYLTIVARDGHGGYMQHADNEEKGIYTKEDLLSRIRVSLAGRAAEILYYGTEDGYSSGASGDLTSATRLANAMLCNYGMDKEFGLAVVLQNNRDDMLMADLRKRVNEILDEQLSYVESVLEKNKEKINLLVKELLAKDHLSGKQIEAILAKDQGA